MKKSAWYYLIFLMIISCSSKKDFRPESHLSREEQNQVMMAVIRYLGKAPENVGNDEKFDKKYDGYYLELAGRHRIDRYFISDSGIHYFLISRAAPSLFEKRVAMGGKMKFGNDWKLLEYEEVFRTWKMKEAELEGKGSILFDAMVAGVSLGPYQVPNSAEEYIEFPDLHTYYDKASRTWKTRETLN